MALAVTSESSAAMRRCRLDDPSRFVHVVLGESSRGVASHCRESRRPLMERPITLAA